MKPALKDERDDERGSGAEHPDLVLGGEEEHPLSSCLLDPDVNDDPAGTA